MKRSLPLSSRSEKGEYEMGNIFDAIAADIREEVCTDLAKGSHVRIERIVSKGQSTPADSWYDESEHEWVIVLRGEAKILFSNNRTVHMQTGSYLNIPAHTKHRVIWTTPNTETVWLAIFYT